ncbi:MAG: hypothetical protein R2752_21355 [Vicinamibacterales bacterium]
MSDASAPRVTVAFAMFCQGYDPEQPTDLRRMTTGLGGWTEDDPPTVELTLAIGLWNAGGPGQVSCRLGVRRPGEDVQYLGEGATSVSDAGEMAILPLKFRLTFDRPGVYWAIGEFNGAPLVEVPFAVSEAPPPTVVPPPHA